MQKMRKSYTVKFKSHDVEYALQDENRAARRHFEESENIIKWCNNKSHLHKSLHQPRVLVWTVGDRTAKCYFSQGVSGYVTGNSYMSRHPLDVQCMAAVDQETDEPLHGGGGINVILRLSQTLNSAAQVA